MNESEVMMETSVPNGTWKARWDPGKVKLGERKSRTFGRLDYHEASGAHTHFVILPSVMPEPVESL